MRNLTITRVKSFVACLGKMKVYIEDPDAGELTINGVPCRKLGDLKNGETATFPISEQAAKVFVIADKLSRNYSNDYYPLSAGAEDVTISGKNAFHPGAGNPFRFYGVTDPEVLARRKKGGRKGLLLLIVAFILGIFIGLGRTRIVEEKDFSVEGMTITLNEEFSRTNYEGFTQCFESKAVAVFTLKEAFSLMPGLEDYTLQDYADLVISANGMSSAELKEEQGILYFAYVTQGGDGEDYYYVATLHKGSDAFWLIQFATPASNQEKLHDRFIDWAATVEFE